MSKPIVSRPPSSFHRHRGLLLSAALGAASGAAGAATAPPGGVVGLLTPTAVEEKASGCLRPDTKARHVLYTEAHAASPVLGSLQFLPPSQSGDCPLVVARFQSVDGKSTAPLAALESAYEEVAIAVLERRGEWHRVALPKGSAWMQAPRAVFRFDAYPVLLKDRVAYTSSWDGQICSAPGTGCRKVDGKANQPLRVTTTRRSGGQDWLQVELTNNPCDGSAWKVKDSGWIPAYNGDRKASAWFHPRGC